MRQFRFLLGFAAVSGIAACAARQLPPPAVERSLPVVMEILNKLPDSVIVVDVHRSQENDLGVLLKTQIAAARAMARTPFVQIDRAQGCPPCRGLAAGLSDPRMIDAFAGTYVIRVEIGEWRDQLLPVLGIDPAAGVLIPQFIAVDESGKPLGPKITGNAWGADIPENMAPPLKAFFRANLRSS